VLQCCLLLLLHRLHLQHLRRRALQHDRPHARVQGWPAWEHKRAHALRPACCSCSLGRSLLLLHQLQLLLPLLLLLLVKLLQLLQTLMLLIHHARSLWHLLAVLQQRLQRARGGKAQQRTHHCSSRVEVLQNGVPARASRRCISTWQEHGAAGGKLLLLLLVVVVLLST
jgi:hypothetical protein